MPLHSLNNPESSVTAVDERGFSLIEVVVAMVVFLIAMLGIFVAFTFAVSFNAGNVSRAQALAVLQQQVENMRAAKFTPIVTDASLTGGVKASQTVVSSDGLRFVVNTTVDDDPFTSGVQINSASTLKEISVTVGLDRPTPGWQTSVPATVVLRRVMAN